MKEITVNEKSENQRLNKFLKKLLPGAGESFLYKMLRKKNITLNGSKAAGNEILKNGDVIRIFFSDETFNSFTVNKAGGTGEASYPVPDKNMIVYEDENILIFNKPAGMLSQKADKEDVSACEYLIGHLLDKGEIPSEDLHYFKPTAVNRLDRNTTGLLVCAKNLEAAQVLSEAFRKRTIKKEYIALVKGRVSAPMDLQGYLYKNEQTNKVVVSDSPNGGSYIETSYTPVKFCDRLDASVLKVELKTGKTHQIRAHLSYIGHPIGGDPKYGSSAFNRILKNSYQVKYQLLHAYRIVFPRMNGKLSALSDREIIVQPPFQNIYED